MQSSGRAVAEQWQSSGRAVVEQWPSSSRADSIKKRTIPSTWKCQLISQCSSRATTSKPFQLETARLQSAFRAITEQFHMRNRPHVINFKHFNMNRSHQRFKFHSSAVSEQFWTESSTIDSTPTSSFQEQFQSSSTWEITPLNQLQTLQHESISPTLQVPFQCSFRAVLNRKLNNWFHPNKFISRAASVRFHPRKDHFSSHKPNVSLFLVISLSLFLF